MFGCVCFFLGGNACGFSLGGKAPTVGSRLCFCGLPRRLCFRGETVTLGSRRRLRFGDRASSPGIRRGLGGSQLVDVAGSRQWNGSVGSCRWRRGIGGRGTGQAPTFDRVPAVRARVLPARQAEVERSVECLERRLRRPLLLLGARNGEGLVEGRSGVGDEVLEPAPERPDLAEGLALPAVNGLERVARATPLAERLGQDLGHRLPVCLDPAASGATRRRSYRPPERGRPRRWYRR